VPNLRVPPRDSNAQGGAAGSHGLMELGAGRVFTPHWLDWNEQWPDLLYLLPIRIDAQRAPFLDMARAWKQAADRSESPVVVATGALDKRTRIGGLNVSQAPQSSLIEVIMSPSGHARALFSPQALPLFLLDPVAKIGFLRSRFQSALVAPRAA
jgi:hypothetical protein